MSYISIQFAVVGIVVLFSTGVAVSDDRIDLRLNHRPVSSRIATPRLALGKLVEKDKEAELQVKKKRRSSVKSVGRVRKSDSQRKKKTKRVVASQ